MADGATARKGLGGYISSWIKGIVGMVLGVGSGVFVMYSNAIVDHVVKPTKPIANFAVSNEGLTVTCLNHAGGDSGWWDFGDGSPLVPYDPTQQSIQHDYAKTGNYSVKLTVRNFLLEENERSVPVDLSTPPKTLPPTITGLKVEPLGSGGIAPAGFKLTGEVANAERIIFDMGNKPLVVDTENGPFEKYVVFDTAGVHAIRLTGVNGKVAVKQEATVTVRAAEVGSVSFIARVSDSGNQVERRTVASVNAVPLPKKNEKTFEKTIVAEPGYTITKGDIGKFNPGVMKNVKLQIAADKKSGKITGEWAVSGDALSKSAGGSEAMVPFTLTEERTKPTTAAAETLTGIINPTTGIGTINLPPMPRDMVDVKRTIKLDIVRAGGDGKRDVLHSEADLKPGWKGIAVTRPDMNYAFGATINGNSMQVQMRQAK